MPFQDQPAIGSRPGTPASVERECPHALPQFFKKNIISAAQEEWNERAAIMEFDGRMSRIEAEIAATRIVYGETEAP